MPPRRPRAAGAPRPHESGHAGGDGAPSLEGGHAGRRSRGVEDAAQVRDDHGSRTPRRAPAGTVARHSWRTPSRPPPPGSTRRRARISSCAVRARRSLKRAEGGSVLALSDPVGHHRQQFGDGRSRGAGRFSGPGHAMAAGKSKWSKSGMASGSRCARRELRRGARSWRR